MNPEAVERLSDKELFDKLSSILTSLVTASPYSKDGSFASAIRELPTGLREMAATHCLDISLTRDDIGRHFLNFGEPGLVRETVAGLRELGLQDIANCFREATIIVSSLRADIRGGVDYEDGLAAHGQDGRIAELNQIVKEMGADAGEAAGGSAIFAAWIRYARSHPDILLPF